MYVSTENIGVKFIYLF